jgi:hypothetical protein
MLKPATEVSAGTEGAKGPAVAPLTFTSAVRLLKEPLHITPCPQKGTKKTYENQGEQNTMLSSKAIKKIS